MRAPIVHGRVWVREMNHFPRPLSQIPHRSWGGSAWVMAS